MILRPDEYTSPHAMFVGDNAGVDVTSAHPIEVEATTPAADTSSMPVTQLEVQPSLEPKSVDTKRVVAGFILGGLTALSVGTFFAADALETHVRDESRDLSWAAKGFADTVDQAQQLRNNAFQYAVAAAIEDYDTANSKRCVSALELLRQNTEPMELHTANAPSSDEIIQDFAVDNPCGEQSAEMADQLVELSYLASDAYFVNIENARGVDALDQDAAMYKLIKTYSVMVGAIALAYSASGFIGMGFDRFFKTKLPKKPTEVTKL